MAANVFGSTNYCLTFADEFDGPEINRNFWKHEVTMSGGGKWEFQW